MIGRHHVAGSSRVGADAAFATFRKLPVAFTAVGSAVKAAVSFCFYRLDKSSRPARPQLGGNLLILRVLPGSRILLFPQKIVQLWRLNFLRPFIGHMQDRDTFFFLTHNYYLSKYLTLGQRVDSAVTHYRHEKINCGAGYHQSVYRSREGLPLWFRVVNGTKYKIVLQATEDVRTEGDLSILCLVDATPVCRISFSYVKGSLFGVDSKITLYVTRNQTYRGPALEQFRRDFKQNSPPYFCVAAVSGIAMAHGIRQMCLIKDDAQIAYDKQFADSFRNSYSEFWQIFGAREIADRHAFVMTLPVELNPISAVKHKSRAISRRQNWLDIMVHTRQVILENRITRSPHPIDVDTSAFLPSAAENLGHARMEAQ